MLKEKVILLDQSKDFKRYKDQDIIKLLKLIVLDGETDLKKITTNMFIPQRLIEKYLGNENIMREYLTESEYEEFLIYYNKLTNFLIKLKDQDTRKPKEDETELAKKLIADIMGTRLSKAEILKRNAIGDTVYYRIVNDEARLEKIYGPGFSEILKRKIKLRSIERESVPRNMYIVEEREDIIIVKEGITYLNECDFKRMKIASYYVNSGFDIDEVAKKTDLSTMIIINNLLSEKNKEILEFNIYGLIKNFASVENLLLTGSILDRKKLVSSVMDSLEKNNYDINLVSQELKMPVPLIKNCLKQTFITIYYSAEQVKKINEILYSEKLEKNKGM